MDPAEKDENEWGDLLRKYEESLKDLESKTPGSIWDVEKPTQNISEAIKNRKAELENESFAQDIELKRETLFILFGFLAIETIAIFVMAFLQGFKTYGFQLEEWSFRILTSVTITQITVMLLVAVRHLFPQKLNS